MARTLLSNNKQQALRDKDSFVTAFLRGDKRCVALCVKISPLRDIPYVTLRESHVTLGVGLLGQKMRRILCFDSQPSLVFVSAVALQVVNELS